MTKKLFFPPKTKLLSHLSAVAQGVCLMCPAVSLLPCWRLPPAQHWCKTKSAARSHSPLWRHSLWRQIHQEISSRQPVPSLPLELVLQGWLSAAWVSTKCLTLIKFSLRMGIAPAGLRTITWTGPKVSAHAKGKKNWSHLKCNAPSATDFIIIIIIDMYFFQGVGISDK